MSKDCSSCLCLQCDNAECFISECEGAVCEPEYYEEAIKNCYTNKCVGYIGGANNDKD